MVLEARLRHWEPGAKFKERRWEESMMEGQLEGGDGGSDNNEQAYEGNYKVNIISEHFEP